MAEGITVFAGGLVKDARTLIERELFGKLKETREPKPLTGKITVDRRDFLSSAQEIALGVFGRELVAAWIPDVKVTGEIEGRGRLEIPARDPSDVRIILEQGAVIKIEADAFLNPSQVEILVKNGGKVISDGKGKVKIINSKVKFEVEGVLRVKSGDPEIFGKKFEIKIPEGTTVMTAGTFVDELWARTGEERGLSERENLIREKLAAPPGNRPSP